MLLGNVHKAGIFHDPAKIDMGNVIRHNTASNTFTIGDFQGVEDQHGAECGWIGYIPDCDRFKQSGCGGLDCVADNIVYFDGQSDKSLSECFTYWSIRLGVVTCFARS